MRPRWITKNLRDAVVYWSPGTIDGYGSKTYGTATQRVGRWEDRQELFIDASGQEVRSEAVVYLNQDVAIGGYLYKGGTADLDSAQNPKTQSGAREIRAFRKITNLRNEVTERKAWL